jgi:hypothetical protein
MFPTLVGLLALMEAYLLDGTPPPLAPGGAVGGLTDEDLWTRIASKDGDVLAGMDFSTAVTEDPRRIAALIEQRVLDGFYRPLSYLSGKSEGAIRHSWLAGYAALREQRGHVDAVGIRDLWLSMQAQETVTRGGQTELQPPNYLRLLDAGVAMARPGTPARSFWESTEGRQGDLRRMFSEAQEIAGRAALCADDEAAAEAWQQIAVLLQNLDASIGDRLAAFLANPPAARARRGEQVGGLRFGAAPPQVSVGIFGALPIPVSV